METIKELKRTILELKAEVAELKANCYTARQEAKQFEDINKELNCRRIAMNDSLIREKMELEARLLLIDVRFKVLGLHPDQIKK
jgi:hypothetical protein